jgi:hypothetical protein
VSRATHRIEVAEDIGDLLVSRGRTCGGQKLRLYGHASAFGENLLAERLVASQLGLSRSFAFCLPVSFERLQRFPHNQLPSVEAYTRALDRHDALTFSEWQRFHNGVDRSSIVLRTHTREKFGNARGLLLLSFCLAFLLGVRPGVLIAQTAPLSGPLLGCTLRLSAVSLSLNPTV